MTQPVPANKPMGKFNGWLHRLFDSDMFTTKQILKMFYPLLLDQFSIYLIGVLATALVSSVGQEALAAVSMVNTLSYMVSAVLFALGAGGGVIIAQAKGSGDENRLRNAVATAAMMEFGSMLVIALTLYVFAEPVITLIYPNTEPLLKEYAVHYLKLNMLSQIPFSVFYGVFTAFRSTGDSKSSLVLTLYINISHLLLSILFINVMKLGVTGSGLSFIVARVIGAIVGLWWIFKPMGSLHVKPRNYFRIDKTLVRPIVKLSIPFSVEHLLFQGGMVVVQGYLSSWGETPEMGTLALAAHAVANSLMSLYQACANCVTTMTATVCGQCIGAGKIDLAKRYKQSMIKGGRLVLALVLLILYPMTPLLLKLYDPNPDAVRMIYLMLTIGVVPLPLIWCNAYVTSTTMNSAGDVKYSTYASLLSMLLCRVALGYVLTIVLNLGPVGIWLGMLVEWLLRMVLVEKRFKSGKWMRHVVHKGEAAAAG